MLRRVLLDRNIPSPVGRFLGNCVCSSTDDEGWSTLANGKLLAAAESSGYDVMVSADLRIKTQQNLVGRKLALVVLSTPAWPVVRQHLSEITSAVETIAPGGYVELTFPRPTLRRRAWTPQEP